MQRPTRRAAIAIGAVCAAALVGAVGAALTPAQAHDSAAAIIRTLAVIGCSSNSACSGGLNSGSGVGVLGKAASNNGIDGGTKSPSTTHTPRSGVYGHDDSTDGGTHNVGVTGLSKDGFGMQAFSTNNIGLFANSTNSIGLEANGGTTGILGFGNTVAIQGWNANNGYGVAAFSAYGVPLVGQEAPGNPNAVLQLYGSTSDQSGVAMMAFDTSSTTTFTLDNAGNVFITGQFYSSGSCHQGCSRTRRVSEYAPRESVPTMEDVGEAQLVAGKAYVSLDAAFANVIDQRATYVVFVSPEGPNQGLYVTQKTVRGFEVMENPGGHSTIPFGYRIVAKPYGVTGARLPMRVQPPMPPSHLLPPAGAATMPHRTY
jgi:hypothetical protein